MKRLLFLIIFVLGIGMQSALKAQNEEPVLSPVERAGVSQADSMTNLVMNTDCQLPSPVSLQPYAPKEFLGQTESGADSLSLPALDVRGQVPLMSYPYDGWWGFNNWTLHRGLNLNLGASVFAAFGKGAPKGAGFSQDLSVMYAVPLTKHLSLAVGGWVNNAYWAHDRFTDAGLSAVLGYKFDEHWEAYVYARKSLVSKPLPYRFCSMDDLGDRIGAAVKYNFSPSFSMQVSVSVSQTDYRSPFGGMPDARRDRDFGRVR